MQSNVIDSIVPNQQFEFNVEIKDGPITDRTHESRKTTFMIEEDSSNNSHQIRKDVPQRQGS